MHCSVFPTAKRWKRPKCLSTDKQNVEYKYTGILAIKHNEVLIPELWNYVKCNKPDTKGKILYDSIIWNI